MLVGLRMVNIMVKVGLRNKMESIIKVDLIRELKKVEAYSRQLNIFIRALLKMMKNMVQQKFYFIMIVMISSRVVSIRVDVMASVFLQGRDSM